MMTTSWFDKRVLIIGAARQGTALASYLVAKGAHVILNDQRSPEQLASLQKSLDSQLRESAGSLTWALGGHDMSLLDDMDLICPSGGVPLTLPLIAEAISREIPLSNDSQIFLEGCPCLVIGITGSAGKTTTTTLVGRMASALTDRRAWVGGNIGTPLISSLDAMDPEDIAVMELSSFQLELMTLSPQVATILNITPNHLDRHGTMSAYIAAKAHILEYQSPGDVVILGREDVGAWALADLSRGTLFSFGRGKPSPGLWGTYLDRGQVIYRDADREIALLDQATIELRGEHNLLNVLAACAIAVAAGFPIQAIQAGIRGFKGVAHRLEYVRTWRGADWYNDSMSTAPERAMAGLRAFDEPVVLLAGGKDKNLPWDAFAALICERVAHLITFGETAEMIADKVNTAPIDQRPGSITVCNRMEQALECAAALVHPGQIVLLSPGGTSFDEFDDYAQRGERFKQWIMQQK